MLLTTQFHENPLVAGWEGRGFGDNAFLGEWANADSDEPYLACQQGYWFSPAIPVQPYQYYRLRFTSRTSSDSYCAAVFFDASGAELAADCYDSVFASEDWHADCVCFRAHALAAHVRIRFQPRAQPLHIREVSVQPASAQQVRQWADHVAAGNPPLRYEPPRKRWRHLGATMKTLEAGGDLRVVLLGDSIANDTGNSAFDVLLERAYPGSRIEVVNSVRGATGCPYYREEGRVQEYVLRYQPNLVIIAGLSHNYNVEAIQSVVEQIRAAANTDIAVMTGAVASEDRLRERYVERSGQPLDAARRHVETFRPRLQRMAEEEKVEFINMREPWDNFIEQSPRPHSWYLRDAVHANRRGKQVLARIILAYFTSRSAGEEPSQSK